MKSDYHEQMTKEFDRQVGNLLQKRYPQVAGVRADEFIKHIQVLRAGIRKIAAVEKNHKEASIPFVIVVKNQLMPGEKAITLVELKNKKGFTHMDANEIKAFSTIEGIKIPNGMAYLLVDVDTGKGSLNITPNEAIMILKKEKRSPLTIEEGIALITHHSEILKNNNCFSMLGSRCGDRRVTALWISGGRPRLGWCWAGNPHSWLGSASCSRRVGL